MAEDLEVALAFLGAGLLIMAALSVVFMLAVTALCLIRGLFVMVQLHKNPEWRRAFSPFGAVAVWLWLSFNPAWAAVLLREWRL